MFFSTFVDSGPPSVAAQAHRSSQEPASKISVKESGFKKYQPLTRHREVFFKLLFSLPYIIPIQLNELVGDGWRPKGDASHR